MSKERVLYWIPRSLGFLFALFLSLFALGRGSWRTTLDLLLLLVPVYIVIVVLIIAWRWEWVGAILFTALAVIYVGMTWRQSLWSADLAISGPLLLLGVLFLVNWSYGAQSRAQ
ncbi:MAG: hypothetical protein ABSA01_13210 [Anaerolineales bacterium]|jgi:hypothetical protein